MRPKFLPPKCRSIPPVFKRKTNEGSDNLVSLARVAAGLLLTASVLNVIVAFLEMIK